ncbi:MFS transporter [Marinilactibacillus sp. XAAS-LB27]|uniref:MFS transporter n=1 Tax=Marinilactibacillus sp. XAAS-LB27 TaxID=3114538 RepID=UPI002E19EE7E|nr:MFS transporter [Marinilactibacillus sp. XAAS-LB27]
MYSLLLLVIYIAFISLGLPDSLLGSAWPVMQGDLNVPVSYAGLITMTIAGGTIISSLLSDKLTKRLGTGLVTFLSVLTTAVALFGFSISSSFISLIFWAIPYGLGAGAVDAALNNYVALYYGPRHMNWLHCFWGVGASVSPYIMGFYLTRGASWSSGYQTVGVIQVVISLVLLFSLPLWKGGSKSIEDSEIAESKSLTFKQIFRLSGIVPLLIAFFAYQAIEQTTGLWASTYLVEARSVDPETAAQFASFFFLGITFGRFVCGFIANHLGDKKLIRIGTGILFVGILLLFIPTTYTGFALSGLVIIGIGCAPIYPSVIHSTPANFGKAYSQSIIGIQMAVAYFGTTFMPPLFGWIASILSIQLYPVYLCFFTIVMFIYNERLNTIVKNRSLKITSE